MGTTLQAEGPQSAAENAENVAKNTPLAAHDHDSSCKATPEEKKTQPENDSMPSSGGPRSSPYGLAELEADAKDIQMVQKRVLREILHLHQNTEYLKRYGLDGSSSVEAFKQKHPVARYSQFAEYIIRESKGESQKTGQQILCAEPVIGFMLTSGSSGGARKMIPRTVGSTARQGTTMSLFQDINRRAFGKKDQLPMTFVHVGLEFPLECGLSAASGTTIGLRQMLKDFPSSVLASTTSPAEVFATTDGTQATYCHLLCSLAQRERVTDIRANFLIHVVSGLQFLEKHWESFVKDIREGSVNPDIVTDAALRSAVQERVPPQPVNASALEAEFRRGFDGIVERIWPAVDAVQAVCTGAMLQYVPWMEKYAGKSVPLVSPLYNASEAPIGINLNPKVHPNDVTYTVLPRNTYWEFIPVDEPELEAPVTKSLHELEEGRSYEIVLTNGAGLYRYRLEDVVKVTGFWHGLPQVAYEYRRGTLSMSAGSEKVTEKDLAHAVQVAERLLPSDAGRLLDYTVAVDAKADPIHYTVFWEVDGFVETVTKGVLEECARSLDSSLASSNSDYEFNRHSNRIGGIELCLVKKGTFEAFKGWKLENGMDAAQYKVPRCLKTAEQQSIFTANLLRSSSTDCHWLGD